MRLQAFRWTVLAAVACADVVTAGWLRHRDSGSGVSSFTSASGTIETKLAIKSSEFTVSYARRRIAALAGLFAAVVGPT